MEVVLQAQIKNGLLYRAVQKCGSQSGLARYLNVAPNVIGRWLKFKETPNFRRPNVSQRAKYEQWDALFVGLIGYGLNEIFPEEIEKNQAAVRDKAKIEAVMDMPVERLIEAGMMPQLPPAPDENLLKIERSDQIRKVLNTLTPREEKVVRLRYGINGQPPMTWEEIGVEIEVTRARARQIEAKAMRRLRHLERSGRLKPYIQHG